MMPRDTSQSDSYNNNLCCFSSVALVKYLCRNSLGLRLDGLQFELSVLEAHEFSEHLVQELVQLGALRVLRKTAINKLIHQ